MEPVSIVLGALAAGTVAATQETAGQAVKDAYTGLKGALQRRFADRPVAQAAVVEYPKDKELLEALLTTEITRSGAERDPEIMRYVEELRRLGVVQLKQSVSNDTYGVHADRIGSVTQGPNAQTNVHYGKDTDRE